MAYWSIVLYKLAINNFITSNQMSNVNKTIEEEINILNVQNSAIFKKAKNIFYFLHH